MRPNPQETFTEEILNGQLHFLCGAKLYYHLHDCLYSFVKEIDYKDRC